MQIKHLVWDADSVLRPWELILLKDSTRLESQESAQDSWELLTLSTLETSRSWAGD